MKKAVKAIFSVVIMLTLAITAQTFAMGASSKKDDVYKFLTNELGFNSAAACGIMANIEHESNFDSTGVIVDSNGLLSGGLCQWNGSRFSSLKNFCNKNGYDYLSVKGQLKYLEYELSSNYYKHIYNYLKGVSNSSSGAYDAAYYWCYYFEVPQNRATSAKQRGNSAKNSYWPKYSSTALKDVKLTCSSSGKTVDIGETVKFTWNNTGTSTKKYIINIAQKKGDSYDWKNAKTITVSSDTFSYSFKTKDIGTFKAYVLAKSSNSSKKSQSVKFSVKCLTHSYESTVIKKASSSSAGVINYTCKTCSKSYQESIPKISVQSTASEKISSLAVKSATSDSITLKWAKQSGISGYQVYRFYNGKQKESVTLKSNATSVKFSKLSSAKTYQFKIRTYTKKDGKTVYSSFQVLNAATAPEKVTLKSIFRPSKSVASVNWEAQKGVDGYIIYASTSKDGKYKQVATACKDATNCKVKNLKSGKYYYFKIRSYKKAENNTAYSSYSNVKYIIAK